MSDLQDNEGHNEWHTRRTPLRFWNFLEPARTFLVSARRGVIRGVSSDDGGAVPSDTDVITAAADGTLVGGLTFSAWLPENGGDPVLTNRRRAQDEGVDGDTALSIAQRAELGERNQRDNYLATRLIEIQATLSAMKVSLGNAQAIRDAIPASWTPTATRDRSDARQSLRDEIDSGGSDT